jgi:SAM-dependent methyltransferase
VPIVASSKRRWSSRTRFAVLAAGGSALFLGTAPWFIESAPLVFLAERMAGWAAEGLSLVGASSMAKGPILFTGRGAFLVTGECIATPLVPMGIAAALTLPASWGGRTLALAACLPLFVGLGVVRLFVLALPSAVASAPEFWVHAFFQILAAIAVVAGVAVWRHGWGAGQRSRTVVHAVAAVGVGVTIAAVLGQWYARALLDMSGAVSSSGSMLTNDPQGALAMLPSFQVGLLGALALAWFGLARGTRSTAIVLLVLVVSHVALFAAGLPLAIDALPVPLLRGWALGWPLALAALATTWPAAPAPADRQRARESGPSRYRRFWEGVGTRFPDLAGAASTDYYRRNEQRLLSEHLPRIDGARILKTDLWDEARNTRILQWVQANGAAVYGVDISHPTTRLAREAFGEAKVGALTADCRVLPFGSGRFDAIYSMGTIEHDVAPEAAVREMYRVLKPGGRAIVGVPNRWDPFLRPALARVMQAFGLYAYGRERSYSRVALRRMLVDAGFQIDAETAILFIPGWLRMLDLACHAWWPPAAHVTRLLVAPFVWLDAHVPAVRRHGYLLATVAIKPAPDGAADEGDRSRKDSVVPAR